MTGVQTCALPISDVAVRDLYQLYPDFYIDVAAEQAAQREAREEACATIEIDRLR